VPLASLAPLAAAAGVAGVFASGRLYVVPGRPAWHTPLTVVAFHLTALATGTLLAGHAAVAAAAVGAQLAVWLANLVRLGRDRRREWRGTFALYRHRFAGLTAARWALAAGGAAAGLSGAHLAGFALVATGEVIGRYLFFVTVVPLDMPGSFARTSGRRH
jgi:DMSO reductase anchor subunit